MGSVLAPALQWLAEIKGLINKEAQRASEQ